VKYAFIKQQSTQYPVTLLCRVMGVNRGSRTLMENQQAEGFTIGRDKVTDGGQPAKPTAGIDSSFGSWQPICQSRLSGYAETIRHGGQHEWQGKRPGQCPGRTIFQQPETGMDR